MGLVSKKGEILLMLFRGRGIGGVRKKEGGDHDELEEYNILDSVKTVTLTSRL